MSEKRFNIDLISPVDFYGVNNSNIERIKKLFPELKISARGNEIIVHGEYEKLILFEIFIDKISETYSKFNKLTENDIVSAYNNKEVAEENGVIVYGKNGKPVKPKTEGQKKLIEEFDKNDLIFAIGPAGTGKTYMAISLAVRALKNKEVKRIILSRPAVEAGEHLGFLPGDLKDKLDPYLQALYDALYDMVPGKKLADLMEQGVVQIAPLAYMRGRTLSNSFVILDEAQNTSLSQLKMFLTRMGENSKFIVTGDITQIDLPEKGSSGLLKAHHLFKNIKGISFVEFSKNEVIRHYLVSKIIDAFEKEDKLNIQ